MYAVIETGGKQYRVEVGTELQVELLDVEPGKTITLDRVLLVADGDEARIGRPLVDGAAVSAEVLRQDRGEKLIAFKYRPKARRRVKKGHRQELTVLRVSDIVLGGKSAAKAAAKAETDAKTERAATRGGGRGTGRQGRRARRQARSRSQPRRRRLRARRPPRRQGGRARPPRPSTAARPAKPPTKPRRQGRRHDEGTDVEAREGRRRGAQGPADAGQDAHRSPRQEAARHEEGRVDRDGPQEGRLAARRTAAIASASDSA